MGKKSDHLCVVHHERERVALCSRCDKRMCEECWTYLWDGKPACSQCSQDAQWQKSLAWSYFVLFSLLWIAAGIWITRRWGPVDEMLIGLWLGVAMAVGGGAYVANGQAKRRGAESSKILPRPPKEEFSFEQDPLEHAAHPFRARFVQVAKRTLPPMSARTTAFATTACLLFAAMVVPSALRIPKWLDIELILALWWMGSAALLSVLLYRGQGMHDDHSFKFPWSFGKPKASSSNDGPALTGKALKKHNAELAKSKSGGSNWGLDSIGSVDGEGCLVLAVAIAVALVALASAFLVIDLLLPLVFFLVYGFVVRALGRVVNDKHECAGNLPRAMTWGIGWATFYIVPLGLLVFAAHWILMNRL